MLTGTALFEGRSVGDVYAKILTDPTPSAHAVASDLPEALDAVLALLLRRDPAERTRNAQRFLEQLEEVAAAHPNVRATVSSATVSMSRFGRSESTLGPMSSECEKLQPMRESVRDDASLHDHAEKLDTRTRPRRRPRPTTIMGGLAAAIVVASLVDGGDPSTPILSSLGATLAVSLAPSPTWASSLELSDSTSRRLDVDGGLLPIPPEQSTKANTAGRRPNAKTNPASPSLQPNAGPTKTSPASPSPVSSSPMSPSPVSPVPVSLSHRVSSAPPEPRTSRPDDPNVDSSARPLQDPDPVFGVRPAMSSDPR